MAQGRAWPAPRAGPDLTARLEYGPSGPTPPGPGPGPVCRVAGQRILRPPEPGSRPGKARPRRCPAGCVLPAPEMLAQTFAGGIQGVSGSGHLGLRFAAPGSGPGGARTRWPQVERLSESPPERRRSLPMASLLPPSNLPPPAPLSLAGCGGATRGPEEGPPGRAVGGRAAAGGGAQDSEARILLAGEGWAEGIGAFLSERPARDSLSPACVSESASRQEWPTLSNGRRRLSGASSGRERPALPRPASDTRAAAARGGIRVLRRLAA